MIHHRENPYLHEAPQGEPHPPRATTGRTPPSTSHHRESRSLHEPPQGEPHPPQTTTGRTPPSTTGRTPPSTRHHRESRSLHELPEGEPLPPRGTTGRAAPSMSHHRENPSLHEPPEGEPLHPPSTIHHRRASPSTIKLGHSHEITLWSKHVDHCKKLIKENWDREMKMDANDRHLPLIINLGDNDDEDESNSGDDEEEKRCTTLDRASKLNSLNLAHIEVSPSGYSMRLELTSRRAEAREEGGRPAL
uniref:Uncharacterized protein n=1 Tax=Timema genevievae TaxID=629358 RepID=A0A7R9PK66_TIMGE|nr:unnamed protein product [Timema genevievae]